MKIKEKRGQVEHLGSDSQKRLLAYTTAAGLGAFFAGQNAGAQVTASAAFAPYPATLPAASGTNTVDFAFDVDGDGSDDFQFIVFGEGMVPDHSQVADLIGLTNSLGTTNLLLNDSASSYLHAWLGGTTIDGSTGVVPTYKPRLAIAYGSGVYLNNKFPAAAALGFSFVSGLDGQTHFGYLDVRVNGSTNGAGGKIITSLTVNDVYYNATPDADITIPEKIVVSNVVLGADSAVTINFSSTTNTPASELILESSPALGASANWTADTGAVITQTTVANPQAARPLAYYQAVTAATSPDAQFFRIRH